MITIKNGTSVKLPVDVFLFKLKAMPDSQSYFLHYKYITLQVMHSTCISPTKQWKKNGLAI